MMNVRDVVRERMRKSRKVVRIFEWVNIILFILLYWKFCIVGN
jgi:hypothetical protein